MKVIKKIQNTMKNNLNLKIKIDLYAKNAILNDVKNFVS